MTVDDSISKLTRRVFPYVPGRRHLVAPLRDFFSNEDARGSFVMLKDFDGDLRFSVDRECYLGSSIYWSGYHHVSEVAYLKRTLSPEMTFVDIGANQGEFTVVAAKCLSRGRVLSFEPESGTFQRMKGNVEANGFENVSCHNFGLGREEGYLPLYIPSAAGDSVHNEGTFTSFAPNDSAQLLQEIRIRRLDDVLEEANMSRVDMMKIDVEGGELAVLQGAERCLHAYRPRLILEINCESFAAAGFSLSEVKEVLKPLGYRYFRFRKVMGWTQEIELADHYGHTFNVLCVAS